MGSRHASKITASRRVSNLHASGTSLATSCGTTTAPWRSGCIKSPDLTFPKKLLFVPSLNLSIERKRVIDRVNDITVKKTVNLLLRRDLKDYQYGEGLLGLAKTFEDQIFPVENNDLVPYFYNDYWYIKKFVKGKDYPIYTRKYKSLEKEISSLKSLKDENKKLKLDNAKIKDYSVQIENRLKKYEKIITISVEGIRCN